jgi:hypothetical protein
VTSQGTSDCQVTSSTGILTFSEEGQCLVEATAAARTGYTAGSTSVTFLLTDDGSGTPDPVTAPASDNPAPRSPDLFADESEAISIPGGATLMVGSSQVPMTVTANSANTGVDMSMGQWQCSITPTQPSTALPLGPQSELRTTPGQTLDVSGTSYLRGTSVNIYIMSTPILIGTADVTPSGTFATTVTIPPTMSLGKHTIQIVGVNPGNEVSRASLGISVIPGSTDTSVVTSPIGTQAAFIRGTTRLTRIGQTALLSLVGQVPAQAIVTRALIQVRVDALAPASEVALARNRAESVVEFMTASGITGPFSTKVVRGKGKGKAGMQATAKVSLWFST